MTNIGRQFALVISRFGVVMFAETCGGHEAWRAAIGPDCACLYGRPVKGKVEGGNDRLGPRGIGGGGGMEGALGGGGG